MQAKTLTVGIPVRDLEKAIAWYRMAFELDEPDQLPMDGLAEFDLGAFWLQLALTPARAGVEGISVNISVDDALAEQQRLAALGLPVTPVQRIEGVVEYFELADLDGNKIGFVTELG